MKKYLLIISFLSFSTVCFSQENETAASIQFNKEHFLKELSDNACKCVDSIDTFDKSTENISSQIHSCIDKQVGAYQMGIKLASIKDLEATANETDGKKNINITINTNPDSKEYKKYYFEIEKYLFDNCPDVKKKISSNNKLREKSLSNDKEALKYYNLGLDITQKGDYEKAIDYYKKAVVFDSEFAFAYDNMGICYRRLNKYDEAIDAYEKSLKIDPNGTMPLQNIAIAFIYKKEYKKAVRAYEHLAEIDDKNPEVYYGIGNIYTQYLFDYEKALDNLCIAYNLYIKQKSPYRTDAEKLIQIVYSEMKKQGKENTFGEILKKHSISKN